MSQNPAVRQPVPVGKYFLDSGKITETQLELALKHRSEFGLKLGQSLVELGFVTEAEMVEALRHQARFPCVHLTGGIVSRHVAAKVGEEVSRRLRAVALNHIAGHTTVALEDPSDVGALDELAHILATRIFPVYAEPSAILRSIDAVFGTKLKTGAPATAAPGAAPSAPRAPDARRDAAGAPARPLAPDERAPDERAVIEKVRAFLHDAFAQSVTDIHLEARKGDMLVRFRADGALREHSRMPGAWGRQAIAGLKQLAKLDAGAREGSIPFVFKSEQLELRLAITPSLHGDSLVLHVVRGERTKRALRDLGLDSTQHELLEEALGERGGLDLVTGPPGCGRATTLHALLARLAAPEKKSVALEQRVRHEHEHVLHVELDPEHGWAEAARGLLHQDPDLLMLGEIDGRETAQLLLEAARAGTAVLASARPGGALEALAWLRQMALEPYLVADGLRCVVAQRLVRRTCTDCKAPIVPDEALRARLGPGKEAGTYFEGAGCAACHQTGYRGRVALFEVLKVTSALRHELVRAADGEALARAARADGFTSLREHGLRLARHGLTTVSEVLSATARA